MGTGVRPQQLPPVVTIDSVPIPSLEEFIAFIKQNNLARQERFFVDFPSLPTNQLNNAALRLLCHQASVPGKNISTRTLRINGLDRQFAHTADYGNEITLEFLMDTDYTPRAAFEDWMNVCIESFQNNDSNEVGWYTDYAKDISLNVLIQAGTPGEALFNWSPTQADLGLRSKIDKSKIPGVNTAIDKLFGRGKRLIDNKFNKIKSQAFGAVSGIAAPLLDLLTEADQIVYQVRLVDAWPKSIQVMPLGYDAVGVQRMNVTFTYHHWESALAKVQLSGEDTANKITQNMTKGLQKFSDKIPNVSVDKLGADLKSKVISTGTKLFGRG
jgi:hypothetical protein